MSLENYDPKAVDGDTAANYKVWGDIVSKLNDPQLNAGQEHQKADTVELAWGPRQVDRIVATRWGKPITDVFRYPKEVLVPLNPMRDANGNSRIPVENEDEH